MNPPFGTPLPAPYKDRRTALLVAGILEIILGACAWLMVAFMILGASVAASQGRVQVTAMIPGMVVYGVAGVLFIVLGIGSMRTRRWARALWLVVATSWAMVGVLGVAMMVVIFPGILLGATPAGAPPPPPGMVTVMLVTMVAFMSVFMVALPIGLALFYRSPHVKATCEAENPEPSWTDACSLPALGAAVWLASMAVTLPLMAFAYHGLFPAFGRFAHGSFGTGLWIFAGALSGIAAFGLYRQNRSLWWLAIALVIGLGASACVTYAVAELRPLYEAMGVDPAQLEQIDRMGLLRPTYMIASSLAAILPLIGLLCWARATFPARREVAPAPSPSEPS